MAKENKKDEKIEFYDLGTERAKAKPFMDKFHRAKTFNSDRHNAYAELMAFYQGNQHLLKTYQSKQPWVVNMNTPYASIAIDNRVSSLLANDYIGELLPLSPDDVNSIESLSKLYKKEWERLNLDHKVRESIKGASVVREYYIHLYLDKNKVVGGTNHKSLGALDAYCIEPGAVYIDPTARSLKEAGFSFVLGRISKEQAEREYPKLKGLFGHGDILTPEDRGEIYVDNDYTTEQSDVYSLMTYYGVGADGKIERARLINGILVEDPKSLERTTYPIIQFRWKKAAQSCYALGLMDEVLSLQKAVTSIESAITNTAIAYAAPSMMVRKGCGIDPKVAAKANGAPGIVYAVDGDLNNAMKPVVPPKVDDNILAIKNDYEQKIDKITGNTAQFLGNIGTAGNTSSGAKMAVDRAKIIEINVLNNISEFVEDLTNALIEYLVYLYAGEKITVYDGKKPDGKGYNFSEIEMPKTEDLETAQYKYYIELETKTPYSKERQKELLLEIFQLERQYDVPIKTVTLSDIIKNSSLENKDEMIARFNLLTRQDAQTKAEVINKLIITSSEQGISPELVNAAVGEIISSSSETPAVDQLMAELEKGFQAELQANEAKMSGAVDQLMATPQSMAEVNDLANQTVAQGQIDPSMIGM